MTIYLHMLLDPDQDASEIGYLEVRRALERVDAGESYRAVARSQLNHPSDAHEHPQRL